MDELKQLYRTYLSEAFTSGQLEEEKVVKFSFNTS